MVDRAQGIRWAFVSLLHVLVIFMDMCKTRAQILNVVQGTWNTSGKACELAWRKRLVVDASILLGAGRFSRKGIVTKAEKYHTQHLDWECRVWHNGITTSSSFASASVAISSKEFETFMEDEHLQFRGI